MTDAEYRQLPGAPFPQRIDYGWRERWDWQRGEWVDDDLHDIPRCPSVSDMPTAADRLSYQ